MHLSKESTFPSYALLREWQEFNLVSFLKYLSDDISWEDFKNIKEAYRIWVEAHSLQFRKSGRPYIIHIEWVLSILKWYAQKLGQKIEPQDLIVAILHDVLEDHPQYFEEIYAKFWYDVIYRIITMSKPNALLFTKWQKVIPESMRKEILNNPIYQLWDRWVDIIPPGNEAQRLQIMSIVWSLFQWQKWNDTSLKIEILSIMKNAEQRLLNEVASINIERISPDGKMKKIQKKWQDFLASLQVLMLSPKNFMVKFSDKTHNLQDIDYRLNLDISPDEARVREIKTNSILRTVDNYRFVCRFHWAEILLPEFESAVTQSRAYSAVKTL
jgi:hypothetical protein